MKTCTKCKIEQPITEFYRRKQGDTHYAQCRICATANQREWRANNPDKYKTQYSVRAKATRKARTEKIRNTVRPIVIKDRHIIQMIKETLMYKDQHYRYHNNILEVANYDGWSVVWSRDILGMFRKFRKERGLV